MLQTVVFYLLRIWSATSKFKRSVRKVFQCIVSRKIKAKYKAIWDQSEFKHKDFLLPVPTKLCQYSANPLLDRAYTRLKLGSSCLGGDTFGNHRYCNICNTIEDIRHVFFECPTYDEPRVELQNELLKIGPIIVSDKTLFNPPKPIAEQIRQAVFQFLTESNLLTKVLIIRTYKFSYEKAKAKVPKLPCLG